MSAAHALPTPPVALTVAGTDSGGGAGIAADLHTFFAHGVFGTLVVSAVTAQNTRRVAAVEALTPSLVDEQIAAVLEDFPLAGVKTGMLASAGIIEVVTARARRGELPNLVVDPVMVAASGGNLLTGDGRALYRNLLAVAELVTPNLVEAEILTGRTITDLSSLSDAARALCDLGAQAALVTGGHLVGETAIDVLCDSQGLREFASARVESRNLHGTGCTLSAAITARLALGASLDDAVLSAKSYVSSAIRASASWQLGAGPGPLDHRLGHPAMVDAAVVALPPG